MNARPPALALKRAVDILGASIALVILSPVVALAAVATLVTLGRPILFRQRRPGLHGRLFTIYKFRTMRSPRPGEIWYETDDRRMTRLGRFMRSTSIDELPEFWNVLRGDMSLVGPRPLLPGYLDTYTAEQQRRHEMRPGVTGWAVVHGRNSLTFEERLEFDVWYVDNWSLGLDARIIARTFRTVLQRELVPPRGDWQAHVPAGGLAEDPPDGDGEGARRDLLHRGLTTDAPHDPDPK